MARFTCPDPNHCTARTHESSANCRAYNKANSASGKLAASTAALFANAPTFEGEVSSDRLVDHTREAATDSGAKVRDLLENADDPNSKTSIEANFMRETLRNSEVDMGVDMVDDAISSGHLYLNSDDMAYTDHARMENELRNFGETAMDYLEESAPEMLVTVKPGDNYSTDDAVEAMMENGWPDSMDRAFGVRTIASSAHTKDSFAAAALLEGLAHHNSELRLSSGLTTEELAREYPDIEAQTKAVCERTGADYDKDGPAIARALQSSEGGEVSFQWTPGTKNDVMDMVQASRTYGKSNVVGKVIGGTVMIGRTPVHLENPAAPRIHQKISVGEANYRPIPSMSISGAWQEDDRPTLF